MSGTNQLNITVQAEDDAAASRQAQALEKLLLEEGPSIKIDRIKASGETLDGGATLAVILASPVLLELARCLRMFLHRYNSSQISIIDEHGAIVAKNISAATVSELVENWANKRNVG